MSGEHELGDGPVQPEYIAQMTAIMQTLNHFINGDAPPKQRKTGIIVLMFPFNDSGGRCNYMSNGANRHDVLKLLREQVKRFEEDVR